MNVFICYWITLRSHEPCPVSRARTAYKGPQADACSRRNTPQQPVLADDNTHVSSQQGRQVRHGVANIHSQTRPALALPGS